MKNAVCLLLLTILNTVMVSFFFIIPVQAYVDPSAVSYVAQAVIGIVVAVTACLTIFRHKIFSFVRKNKNEEKKEVHFKDTADSEKTKSEENRD